MRVILLQDVPKVGRKYEVKNVSDGYAANFLFPKKCAERATEAKIKMLEAKQKEVDAERKVQADLLAKNLASLTDVRVEISAKANDQGHLFKGIHKDEILAALKEQKHIDLPEDALVLDAPIKAVGEHQVAVSVGDTSSHFTVTIL